MTAPVPVTFESTVPSAIAVQASPDTIATQEQSTITAIVRDAAGNLVNNQTVDFKLTDMTGGSLSFATVVTDTEGVAQTVYTASGTPSTSNGVIVAATVQGTAITASTTLTVGGQTVFISLGTGNTIGENGNKTQFQMPWVVQAVDSGGNPVNNVAITFTIHSASRPNWAYAKGTYEVCGPVWQQYNTTPGCTNPPVTCLNEDINLTGVYEASEDINNNGKLDPGDVAVATPGSVITATDGSATFTRGVSGRPRALGPGDTYGHCHGARNPEFDGSDLRSADAGVIPDGDNDGAAGLREPLRRRQYLHQSALILKSRSVRAAAAFGRPLHFDR